VILLEVIFPQNPVIALFIRQNSPLIAAKFLEESVLMQETSRDDIRRLLKQFGIRADEAVIAHLARTTGSQPLRIRLTLEDLTDYGGNPPSIPLRLEIEGEIRRS
jgi:hypothetical protein